MKYSLVKRQKSHNQPSKNGGRCQQTAGRAAVHCATWLKNNPWRWHHWFTVHVKYRRTLRVQMTIWTVETSKKSEWIKAIDDDGRWERVNSTRLMKCLRNCFSINYERIFLYTYSTAIFCQKKSCRWRVPDVHTTSNTV